MEEIRFGCVAWDDVRMRKTGVCSVMGQQPTFRVETSNLDTDVCWITNLDYDFFDSTKGSAGAGLRSHARFRRAEYLREKWTKMAIRLGIIDPSEQVILVSILAARVFFLAQKIFGLDGVPNYQLKDGIRKSLEDFGGFDPVWSNDIVRVGNEATSYYTCCETISMAKDRQIMTFKIPPVSHALEILKHPIPAGSFQNVPLNEVPASTPRDLHAWLTDQKRPTLIKLGMTDFDTATNRLINHGSLTGEEGKRQWATGTELELLLTMCEKITVYEIYQSSEQNNLPKLWEILERNQISSTLHSISLSWSVLMENLWVAVGSANHRPAYQLKRLGDNVKSFNLARPFIRSLDRVLCFHAALKLQRLGFEVMGYGIGEIRVNVANCTAAEIEEAANMAGLLPPCCFTVEEIEAENSLPQDPTATAEQIMGRLMARGRVQDILNYDRELLNRMHHWDGP